MTREGLKLLRAANDGNAAQIIVLLDAGFNVNAGNENGVTPLHFAAGSGKIEAVKALLERQANVNARTTVGVTPLIGAARSGHLGVVELLLEAGADVSAHVDQVAEALSYAGQDALSLASDVEVSDLLREAYVNQK